MAAGRGEFACCLRTDDLMGVDFPMRVVGGRVLREGDGGGVDVPFEGGGGDAVSVDGPFGSRP